ncbi:MAG: FIST N-terminal domain-containing protein [Tepidisphaeraceae bacterium]
MRINQFDWKSDTDTLPQGCLAAQLVLCFGERALLADDAAIDRLAERYPNAHVIACSAGGAIDGPHVLDNSLAVTAVEFEDSAVQAACMDLEDGVDEFDAGHLLGQSLPPAGLVHVLLFAPGLNVNAGQILAGLRTWLPDGVTMTGGLASDGTAFEQTFIRTRGPNLDAPTNGRRVVAIGLYGQRLRVGFGSLGGWDVFGPERTVTKSQGNVLHELDGQPALTLYKEYLGDQAAGLPSSGLFFPLAVRQQEDGEVVVRTLLSVDETDGSITLAGDIPQGSTARLMHGFLNHLIDGARTAPPPPPAPPATSRNWRCSSVASAGDWCSSSGSKKKSKPCKASSAQAALTGFYSNGELCPNTRGAPCAVHNQTMTVTTLAEVA